MNGTGGTVVFPGPLDHGPVLWTGVTFVRWQAGLALSAHGAGDPGLPGWCMRVDTARPLP